MRKALPQPLCSIPHSLLQPPGPLGPSREWRQQDNTDQLPDVVLSEKSCMAGHATVVPLELCALFWETRSKRTSGGD